MKFWSFLRRQKDPFVVARSRLQVVYENIGMSKKFAEDQTDNATKKFLLHKIPTSDQPGLPSGNMLYLWFLINDAEDLLKIIRTSDPDDLFTYVAAEAGMSLMSAFTKELLRLQKSGRLLDHENYFYQLIQEKLGSLESSDWDKFVEANNHVVRSGVIEGKKKHEQLTKLFAVWPKQYTS